MSWKMAELNQTRFAVAGTIPEATPPRTGTARSAWRVAWSATLQLLLAVALLCGPGLRSTAMAADGPPEASSQRILEIGPGDEVRVQVDGQQDMSGTMYVADDGTLTLALIGAVRVAGLSPAEAARSIEQALRGGQYLVNPHVTIVLTQGRTQRISVLGQVSKPGVYPVESTTTMFDLIAAAGGTTADAADTVFIIRHEDGGPARVPVDLRGLSDPTKALPAVRLKSGDSVFVPRAPEFYIRGEVRTPNKYRLEPGMRVDQAIAKAGGTTDRGSPNRVSVERKSADGSVRRSSLHPTDLVQPDDVIEVKERIF